MPCNCNFVGVNFYVGAKCHGCNAPMEYEGAAEKLHFWQKCAPEDRDPLHPALTEGWIEKFPGFWVRDYKNFPDHKPRKSPYILKGQS